MYDDDYKPQQVECPVCGRTVPRSEAAFTNDCHGIPFRLVCFDCWEKILNERGFDGEAYTEADECIDDDY